LIEYYCDGSDVENISLYCAKGCSDNECWHPTIGEQKTAVILYYLASDTEPDKEPDEVYYEILDADNEYSFNNYIIESSYGKMWLTGEVTPWLAVGGLTYQTVITAADQYINYTEVDRVFFIQQNMSGSGAGPSVIQYYSTDEGRLGFVLTFREYYPDKPDLSRHRFVALGDLGAELLCHEFGHSLGTLYDEGVAHAGRLNCGDETYAIEVDGLGDECTTTSLEGTDQVGVGSGHHNSIIKEKHGWFNPTNIIEVTQDGTYTLFPYEMSTDEVLVLKVPRVQCLGTGDLLDPCGGKTQGWYYLEFRRAIGHDRGLFINPISAQVHDGVQIRIDGYLSDRSSLLLWLDRTSTTKQALGEGMTFIDPHRGTTITTISITEEEAVVQIDIADEGYCGDGIINDNEVCDGTNLNGETCIAQGFEAGELGCREDCLAFDTYQCAQIPECRDGVDNDLDGVIDLEDSGCSDSEDDDDETDCGDGSCEGGEHEINCLDDCNITEYRTFLILNYLRPDFGGLEKGDLKCKFDIDSGTWKAWLSNSTTSAFDRLHHSSVPYVLVDGTVVADNWNDLIDGTIQHGINMLPTGQTLPFSTYAWTGTNFDGSSANDNCNDWTTQDASVLRGISTATDSSWTSGQFSTCGQDGRLYCFEQPPVIEEFCGDGICQPGEGRISCPSDCM
ncbi:MAG: hypothetical protein KJ600_05875, partial [Nanoarchaeota archaeon]|nr:hypothetical protein [Nanoarchaeota archaeon]